MSFLYEDAHQCWLMNTETFEQIGLPPEVIGNRRPFLREGMPLTVAFIDDRPELLGTFGVYKYAIDIPVAGFSAVVCSVWR